MQGASRCPRDFGVDSGGQGFAAFSILLLMIPAGTIEERVKRASQSV